MQVLGEALVGEEDSGDEPHGHHRQVQDAGRALDRLDAGDGEEAEAGEGGGAEDAEGAEGDEPGPEGDAEQPGAGGDQDADFEDQEHRSGQEERQQERRASHRGHEQPSQELLLAHLGDREAEEPHAGAHQVQAEQAGEQEVDVAGSGLFDAVDHERGGRVTGPVERAQHAQARHLGIGAVGVDAQNGRVRGKQDTVDAALAERGPRRSVVEVEDELETGDVFERGTLLGTRSLERDLGRLGRGVAKRVAQDHGHQHGKRENPKESLRFAQEQQHADARELQDFAASNHRAGLVRSARGTRRPAWAGACGGLRAGSRVVREDRRARSGCAARRAPTVARGRRRVARPSRPRESRRRSGRGPRHRGSAR